MYDFVMGYLREVVREIIDLDGKPRLASAIALQWTDVLEKLSASTA
jgi:hypothetical protein